MFHTFWQSFKDRKTSLGVYLFATLSMIWMYIALYPSILEQSEAFQEAFSNYPEGIFAALGIEEMSFDTIEKFLAMENYSIMFPVLLLVMVLGLGGAAIAGEVEKGTIEHPLSKSISRLQYYFAKYLLGIVSVLLLSAVTAFAVIPFAELYSIDYQVKAASFIFIISTLFGWTLFSLALMFSAFFSEKSKVMMTTGGIILVMYVFNIVATLLDKIEKLKYLSFFHYYDFNAALIDMTLEWQSVIVLCSAIIIFTVIGAWWFNKRDVAV